MIYKRKDDLNKILKGKAIKKLKLVARYYIMKWKLKRQKRTIRLYKSAYNETLHLVEIF